MALEPPLFRCRGRYASFPIIHLYQADVEQDAIGFEAWPPRPPRRIHDHIALWGMPIGELWDLEALAAECGAQNRWNFFFTSAPLNLKGGISSTPNALAVF